MGKGSRRNHPTIRQCFDELVPLVKGQREAAASLSEYMADIRGYGYDTALLKRWATALCKYEETGDRKYVEAMLSGTEDAVLYARALGYEVASAAPVQHERVIEKVVHVDADTGEIIANPPEPQPAAAAADAHIIEQPAAGEEPPPSADSPAEPIPGPVDQKGDHLACTEGAGGSNPSGSTIFSNGLDLMLPAELRRMVAA